MRSGCPVFTFSLPEVAFGTPISCTTGSRFTKLGYTKPSTELRVDRVLDIAEVCYVFFSDMVYC